MKKLDDIPKKNIFTVPDEYFEKLPGIIQSRVASRDKKTVVAGRLALRYALPAAVLIAVGAFWYSNVSTSSTDPETMLAAIDTPDLIAYLDESEITTDEILDTVVLDDDDANDIEENVYALPLSSDDANDFIDETY